FRWRLFAVALLATGCSYHYKAARSESASGSEVLQGEKGDFEEAEAAAPEERPNKMMPAAMYESGSHAGAQDHVKEPAPGEKLLLTGSVTAITDDLAGLMAAVRAHAAEVSGSIANEELSGD